MDAKDQPPQRLLAPIQAEYRLCRMKGGTEAECRAQISAAHGLKGDYTPKQVATMLFLRYLIEKGRIDL